MAFDINNSPGPIPTDYFRNWWIFTGPANNPNGLRGSKFLEWYNRKYGGLRPLSEKTGDRNAIMKNRFFDNWWAFDRFDTENEFSSFAPESSLGNYDFSATYGEQKLPPLKADVPNTIIPRKKQDNIVENNSLSEQTSDIDIPLGDTQYFPTGFDFLPGSNTQQAKAFDGNTQSAVDTFGNSTPINNSQLNNPTNQIINQAYKRKAGLNFDHILASTIGKNLLTGISNYSTNSQENAIKQYNQSKFNPLNYLPYTPNNSKQALYGMAEGGTFSGEFLSNFTKSFFNPEEEASSAPTPEPIKTKKVKNQKPEDVEETPIDFTLKEDNTVKSDSPGFVFTVPNGTTKTSTTLPKETIDKITPESPVGFVDYLKHQQGARGASLIIESMTTGKPLPRSIVKNMKANVGSDFQGDLTPENFYNYWKTKYESKFLTANARVTEYDDIFKKVAEETNVPMQVLKTFAEMESGMNPKAKNKSHIGMMQISKDLGKSFGVADLTDPYQNILAAAKYINQNRQYAEGGEVGCPPGKIWNEKLKRCVDASERNIIETLSQFIPGYEQFLDYKDILQGAATGNKQMMNRGIVGMSSPLSGKALSGVLDYFTEKVEGKEKADYNAGKREDIINNGPAFNKALFEKYGYGGYDKWVADGKPSLNVYDEGGPIDGINKYQQFYNEYLKSSAYKDRLIGQGYTKEKADQVIKDRLANLNNTKLKLTDERSSAINQGYITVNPNEGNVDEIAAHEYSHKVGASGVKYVPDGNPNLALNDNELNLLNKFNNVKSARNKHLTNPYEAKADIDALRFLMQDNWIQNPDEKINVETLKKALSHDKIKNTTISERLQKRYKLEDLTELLNSLASNNNNESPLIAKFGGKMKSYKLGGTYEVDDSEYERLRKLGYEIEIIK